MFSPFTPEGFFQINVVVGSFCVESFYEHLSVSLSLTSCSDLFLFPCRAFTVTAIAQMCILGLMWVFGAFMFAEGTTVVAYIFTILNSLQGTLVFIMHCLLSKQVGVCVCVY